MNRTIHDDTKKTYCQKDQKNVIYSNDRKYNLDEPNGLEYFWNDLRIFENVFLSGNVAENLE